MQEQTEREWRWPLSTPPRFVVEDASTHNVYFFDIVYDDQGVMSRLATHHPSVETSWGPELEASDSQTRVFFTLWKDARVAAGRNIRIHSPSTGHVVCDAFSVISHPLFGLRRGGSMATALNATPQYEHGATDDFPPIFATSHKSSRNATTFSDRALLGLDMRFCILSCLSWFPGQVAASSDLESFNSTPRLAKTLQLHGIVFVFCASGSSRPFFPGFHIWHSTSNA